MFKFAEKITNCYIAVCSIIGVLVYSSRLHTGNINEIRPTGRLAVMFSLGCLIDSMSKFSLINPIIKMVSIQLLITFNLI